MSPLTADGVRRLAGRFAGAWEDFPWGPDECVLKVGPKAFAFLGIARPEMSVVVKVDPDHGEALRGSHPAHITLPRYLSKRHWVSVRLGGGLPDELVADLVHGSYDLVVAGLTRQQRTDLGLPHPHSQKSTDANVPTSVKPTRA